MAGSSRTQCTRCGDTQEARRRTPEGKGTKDAGRPGVDTKRGATGAGHGWRHSRGVGAEPEKERGAFVIAAAGFPRSFAPSTTPVTRLPRATAASSRMANGSLSCVWWCYTLACAAALVTAGALLVDITYLESAVAKGAVCLDGSAPAYHLARGSGSGANSWLVHFEGGGWCNNVTTCLQRKRTRLGSSKEMAMQIAFSGILSDVPDYNPDFYNWNKVKVRCTVMGHLSPAMSNKWILQQSYTIGVQGYGKLSWRTCSPKGWTKLKTL
ncbi:unnamed protein product [Urochloa humidicola]